LLSDVAIRASYKDFNKDQKLHSKATTLSRCELQKLSLFITSSEFSKTLETKIEAQPPPSSCEETTKEPKMPDNRNPKRC